MLREHRPVLEGLELRFRERVVVGAVRHHPRTGFRLGGLGYERSAGSQFTVRLLPMRFGAGDFVVPPFYEMRAISLTNVARSQLQGPVRKHFILRLGRLGVQTGYIGNTLVQGHG